MRCIQDAFKELENINIVEIEKIYLNPIIFLVERFEKIQIEKYSHIKQIKP